MSKRDLWLRMSDAELLHQCREERYKGPATRDRNKGTTAVRLRHEAAGVVVQAKEGRALEENRRRAVRRLRERIAIEVRAPFDLASPKVTAEFRSTSLRGPPLITPQPDYPTSSPRSTLAARTLTANPLPDPNLSRTGATPLRLARHERGVVDVLLDGAPFELHAGLDLVGEEDVRRLRRLRLLCHFQHRAPVRPPSRSRVNVRAPEPGASIAAA